VILFSHPADFTPVCTSEFITFATLEPRFAKLGCKLVGLSVDGLYSHIAWLRTIKEKISCKGMKDVEVKFPFIEDITMEVARKQPIRGRSLFMTVVQSVRIARHRAAFLLYAIEPRLD